MTDAIRRGRHRGRMQKTAQECSGEKLHLVGGHAPLPHLDTAGGRS
jgi:hypothetical protein